ncbi:hypothetical protein, variant [Verruconis gallopava]|uniref:Zn(2)-C6 fungal-type domain-containing protein n=1 Tax=Verruconis gallopava TaxID=253628 RepID=A0A0D1XBM8_9PEZI|nr:hypothetical protein, variant [Verruconis gallopava]KIV99600.1 hypothetical protein, variant [Verruconis gallopava]
MNDLHNATPARSCIACYQRKLKCDRQQPCQRCAGRNVLCVYPSNKITRNRPKKSRSPSLREKVAKLEKEVIGIKDAQSNAVTVYAVDLDSLRAGESLYVTDESGERKVLSKIGRVKIEDEDEDDEVKKHSIRSAAADVDENKPGIPFMLPMFSSMAGGPSSQAMYAPTATEFENFFALFCERVDPIGPVSVANSSDPRMTKDKHVTTADHDRWITYMPEKWSNFASARPPNPFSEAVCSPIEYALLMSIALAATCSLTEDDPRLPEMFGDKLAGLRKKVYFATEVSISRIKLASTNNFTALQAFTLYITTKILEENTPEVWHTLWCPVALAIRIATQIGVHKDGETIGLSPFDTEMRRRMWWHLVLLSIRTSEDYSCDLFAPGGSPVKLPANLADDQLSPEMSSWPKADDAPTEMSPSLLRYEAIAAVAEAQRRDWNPNNKSSFFQHIQDFEETLNRRYIEPARANPNNERSRLILALGQVAILKMCWVWGYSLMRQKGETPQLNSSTPNLSDELFITVTKMVEQQVILHCEPSLKNLYWILRNIKPWDGVAILLAQLKARLQKQHAQQNFDQLPQMLKDAWNVSTKALELRQHWVVSQNLIQGLQQMRKQVGEMMGLLTDETIAAISALDIQVDDFGPTPILADTMQFDQMDLDAYMVQNSGGNLDDPWPMFIPMNFNITRNGPF